MKMDQLKNNDNQHAGFLHEIKCGKFAGITFIQKSTSVNYPDPEVLPEHSREIVSRMTPQELDRRMSGVIVDEGPIDEADIERVVEKISEGMPGKKVEIIGNPDGTPCTIESPEEWEGLRWDGFSNQESLSMDQELIDYVIATPRVAPCIKGTYNDFNFNYKLTIRLGRVSETEWVWQILAQDERFISTVKDIDTEFVCSRIRPQIQGEYIFLRGYSKSKDYQIERFTANAARMHKIFSRLLDWSVNWPGFAE
jgi:hypothetical protein